MAKSLWWFLLKTFLIACWSMMSCWLLSLFPLYKWALGSTKRSNYITVKRTHLQTGSTSTMNKYSLFVIKCTRHSLNGTTAANTVTFTVQFSPITMLCLVHGKKISLFSWINSRLAFLSQFYTLNDSDNNVMLEKSF